MRAREKNKKSLNSYLTDHGPVCYYTNAHRRGCNFLGEKFMRTKITLECTECKQRNYDNYKNKKNDPDRIQLEKYCRFCKKHTVHKEAK